MSTGRRTDDHPLPAGEPAARGRDVDESEPGVVEPEVEPEGGQRPLADVRGELRRLGYLDHQVERFLLQDALRPERPWRTAGHLAIKVGLLIGIPTALLSTLVLAWVDGHLSASPFDLLPLFLHLLIPSLLMPSLGFLVLSLLLALLLRVWHVRRIEATSFGLALASAAGSVALVLTVARPTLTVLEGWQKAALALAMPCLAWVVFKAVHGGLLTLAIRLTDQAPEEPVRHGRWGVALLAVASFLIMLPAALEVRRIAPAEPSNLPVAGSGRVAVIGVDGVLPAELDYLRARGELGALGSMEADGGVWFPYGRGEEEPVAFWASLATGLPSPLHGIGSIDTYRPLGMSRPLLRVGWLRGYWATLSRLGLASYRPVLANSRSAWSFWELASRGGGPSLVVNWWGTFPAEAQPGAVVAHGAYQLLETPTAAGAVHPAEWASELRAARGGEDSLPGPLHSGLENALGEEMASRIAEQALAPDAFYRDLIRLHGEEDWRLRAVYLPGLDIAQATTDLDSVVMADLVRWQLDGVDQLLLSLPETVDTVLLVFDPGRRGAVEGRAFLWRQGGCASTPDPAVESQAASLAASPDEPPTPVVSSAASPSASSSMAAGLADPEPASVEMLTSAILRALGLPQSAELPEPPAVCAWPDPSLNIASYGRRQPREAKVEGREYLLSLQSLGYL